MLLIIDTMSAAYVPVIYFSSTSLSDKYNELYKPVESATQ